MLHQVFRLSRARIEGRRLKQTARTHNQANKKMDVRSKNALMNMDTSPFRSQSNALSVVLAVKGSLRRQRRALDGSGRQSDPPITSETVRVRHDYRLKRI